MMDHSEYRLLLLVVFLGAVCLGLNSLINRLPEIDIESLEKNISVESTIHFKQSSYQCKVGENIDTTITTSHKDLLKSYKSNNFFLVRIKKNPDYTLKCINCVAVRIYCKRAGKTSVTATTRSGEKVTVPVRITKKTTHTINISKKEINCKAGQKVSTLITASGMSNGKVNNVKSYYIDDTNVATVSRSDLQPNCYGCINVDVNCKKTGNTTLRAVSSLGDKDSAAINVSQPVHNISISKTDIQCEKGETTRIEVKANGKENNKFNGIKSVTVDNSKIATVTDSKIQPKCYGCRYKDVKCVRDGQTTIRAVSTLGDTATSRVTVGKGTIKYDKTEYICQKGKTFRTQITASQALTGIKTFSSDDIAIATVAFSGAQPKCPNCIAVDVTCRGMGTTYLRASSRTGATTASKVTVIKLGNSIAR